MDARDGGLRVESNKKCSHVFAETQERVKQTRQGV
nr:MAG TPA: late expression factor 5 [Caudoviricetes sp.]